MKDAIGFRCGTCDREIVAITSDENMCGCGRFCQHCGKATLPLFTSYYCPHGCDRPGAAAPLLAPACPKCGGEDVASFSIPMHGVSQHCWTCGAAW
jgi:hypothetical protein